MEFKPDFFKGEIRDGFYIEPMMKCAWAVQMDVLEDIQKLCRANNIQYFADGGTLLGTIRHQGYIPWDDDIDIAVLRKDYDRLIEILRKNKRIGEELEISGYEVDKTDMPFLKVYNKSIAVKDNLAKEANRKKGIYNYLNKIVVWIAGKFNKEKLVERYVGFCKKYKNQECRYIQDLTWGTKAVPRALFDEIVDYQFNDITVKGFKDYDTYLKRVYGDYMQLPPEDQRVSHGIKAWRVTENEK